MISQPPRIHLFQGYGIELEYMIVDRDTLAVKPVTDELIRKMTGRYESDFENGMVTWSNELVLHVVELKSTKPELDLSALEGAFVENVRKINEALVSMNAMLMPTGAHPFMDPNKETKLWPHDNNEVYEIYNRIFDCRGHGWANLQSTHLNLPFYDDEEFAKLHAAIRLVLPLLPALCASTPILDGKFTGCMDTRLKYYKTNQARIPSITGRVIPEAVFSKRNYLNSIYEKIKADIKPFDPDNMLNPVWVNSRGAIARFDRGSIEIRIMDCQECPAADMATLTLVIETIKALVAGKFIDYESQMKWRTDSLAQVLDQCVESAHNAIIDNKEYLNIFGLNSTKLRAAEVWIHIMEKLKMEKYLTDKTSSVLSTILNKGPIAQRMISSLEGDYTKENIALLYRRLSECLQKNTLFVP